MDLIPEDIREEFCQEVLARLDWQGRVYRVSGHSGEGCDGLCEDMMDYLDERKEAEKIENQKQVSESSAVNKEE